MATNGFDDDQTRSFIQLTTGTKVSHYTIISKIGAGGMGEVYLAEDSKLKRQVALKFMPVHLASDSDMRTRFTREAQATAKLDHPNIVPIHEVSEFQGRPFFAMAFIEGKSLKEIIKEGKLTVSDTIDLTHQICEGLHEAHSSGVIHRDIKPANIIIDKKGKARIVDFGLATITGEEKLTKTGSTLGTVGYMSPEQIEGKQVDHRSDLFSVGVILYEMLTGHKPFAGETDAAVINAIANSTPEPIARFKSGTSGELQQIVNKALSKDPSIRYQHADGIMADLKALLLNSDSHITIETNSCSNYSYNHREQVTFDGHVSYCDLSPDGRFLAYVVKDNWTLSTDNPARLYVKKLDGGESILIHETLDFYAVAWSPDGSKLLASANVGDRTILLLIPSFGGEPRIYNSPDENMERFFQVSFLAWAPNGEKFAMARKDSYNRILIVDKNSEEASYIQIEGDILIIRDLDWSPDGNFYLIEVAGNSGISIGIVDVDDNQYKPIVEGDVSNPRWNANSNSFYYLKANGQMADLFEISVDLKNGKANGSPKLILSGLETKGPISISDDLERIVILKSLEWSNLYQIKSDSSHDKSGEITPLTTGTSRINFPSVSPTGEEIAFCMETRGEKQIYIINLATQKRRQLTFQGDHNQQPIWSPDGKKIAFISGTDSTKHISVIKTTGGFHRIFKNTKLRSEQDIEQDFSCMWWTPDNNLLLRSMDKRTIAKIDFETETETIINPSHNDAFIYSPACSNQNDKIAYNWLIWSDTAEIDGMPIKIGMWTMSTSGTDLKRIHSRGLPLGWSANDEYLYFWKYRNKPIMRFSFATNTVKTILKLPKYDIRQLSMFPDKKTFVYVNSEKSHDVMLISR